MKFTVYYLSGTLLSALAVLLVYFIDKIPLPLASAGYVNTALFMAYALTYPDAMVRIYFILPVKMKWLAILEAALYVFSVISAAAAGLWGMALLGAAGLAVFLLAMKYGDKLEDAIMKRFEQ